MISLTHLFLFISLSLNISLIHRFWWLFRTPPLFSLTILAICNLSLFHFLWPFSFSYCRPMSSSLDFSLITTLSLLFAGCLSTSSRSERRVRNQAIWPPMMSILLRDTRYHWFNLISFSLSIIPLLSPHQSLSHLLIIPLCFSRQLFLTALYLSISFL